MPVEREDIEFAQALLRSGADAGEILARLAQLASSPDGTRLRDLTKGVPAPPAGRSPSTLPSYDRTQIAGSASSAPSPPRASPLGGAGRNFGRYEILEEVARGAMGIVYRARDPGLARLVALKVLIAGEGASEEQIQRFQREARASASLSHPNIVPIHEVGEQDGVRFFTMAFVEGLSLDRLLRRDGALPPRQALLVARDAARALQHAHDRGIVHRDVKPANLLLAAAPSGSNVAMSLDGEEGPWRAMLSDFGLAKEMGAGSGLTLSGNLLGTPAYMSPEQASGQVSQIDAQSDVFSLGAVLYEAMTGRQPFAAASLAEVLERIRTADPVPPRHHRPAIHRDAELIVLKALAKEKERRYATAGEMADDLDRCLRGEAVIAAPPTLGYRAGRFVRRHRSGVASAAVALLALVAASGWAAHREIAQRRKRLASAEAHLENARRLTASGSFDPALVEIGLAEQLAPGSAAAAGRRRDTRLAQCRAQVEKLGAAGEWDAARAVLDASGDIKGAPGFAALERFVAGTCTLDVRAEQDCEVDVGTCEPGIWWDAATFPPLEAARAAGLCRPFGRTPTGPRDIAAGDHHVVLSRNGAAVRLLSLRLPRSTDHAVELRTLRVGPSPRATHPSLESALAEARAGAVLELEPGDWVFSGPITTPGLLIRPVRDAAARIVAADRRSGAPAEEAHGLALHGLEIVGGSVNPRRCLRPSVVACRIHDSRGFGVNFQDCDDWLVSDCDIRETKNIAVQSNSGSRRGLALATSARGAAWTVFNMEGPGARVVRCEAAAGTRCGIRLLGDRQSALECRVSDCPEFGIIAENGRGVVVRDCLLAGCGGVTRITNSGGLMALNLTDCSLEHNTVAGRARFGISVEFCDGTFASNIAAGDGTGVGIRFFSWGLNSRTNLAWNFEEFVWVVEDRFRSLADLKADPKHADSDALEADPLFVDAPARDFRLASGSPARSAACDGSDIGARLEAIAADRLPSAAWIRRDNARAWAARGFEALAKEDREEAGRLLRKAEAADAADPEAARLRAALR
jgi:hypothetical protein